MEVHLTELLSLKKFLIEFCNEYLIFLMNTTKHSRILIFVLALLYNWVFLLVQIFMN